MEDAARRSGELDADRLGRPDLPHAGKQGGQRSQPALPRPRRRQATVEGRCRLQDEGASLEPELVLQRVSRHRRRARRGQLRLGRRLVLRLRRQGALEPHRPRHLGAPVRQRRLADPLREHRHPVVRAQREEGPQLPHRDGQEDRLDRLGDRRKVRLLEHAARRQGRRQGPDAARHVARRQEGRESAQQSPEGIRSEDRQGTVALRAASTATSTRPPS